MAGLGGALQASYGWAYGVHQRRLVVFSLDGEATLPAQPDPYVPQPIGSDFTVDPSASAEGAVLFQQRCFLCHGPAVVAGGQAPDLRASLVVPEFEQFASVVRDGARAVNGMPAYADITLGELTALQHYIRDRAEADLVAVSGGR
jgi:quinohemoprotein ethanol dehydrogenase